ncbi:MAG TPA: hypothetical protein VG965_02530 [Patescibacteria group bacterium]|nr:hypothetical protein [Patescibacteria group bacterium]
MEQPRPADISIAQERLLIAARIGRVYEAVVANRFDPEVHIEDLRQVAITLDPVIIPIGKNKDVFITADFNTNRTGRIAAATEHGTVNFQDQDQEPLIKTENLNEFNIGDYSIAKDIVGPGVNQMDIVRGGDPASLQAVMKRYSDRISFTYSDEFEIFHVVKFRYMGTVDNYKWRFSGLFPRRVKYFKPNYELETLYPVTHV